MTKEKLENYEPKGELKGFTKEIIARMLDYQEEQGNKRDVSVFEKSKFSPLEAYGFAWNRTKEKDNFWYDVISNKNFNIFFERYPKQDNQYNSQELKVGDEVIDIILGQKGKIYQISTNDNSTFPIYVSLIRKKDIYIRWQVFY